jgi:7-carboxy-7-deazaguanine synthase
VSLPVVESFLSFQGEGPRAGRLSHFIRFGGCNLSCGFAGGWQCDSGYTWDARNYNLRDEMTMLQPEEIVARTDPEADDVVLTGGEPLMHQRNSDWPVLLRLLSAKGKFICVETNGTLEPNQATQTFVQHYSISPKLSNTQHKPGQNPELADWQTHLKRHHTCLKFVVSTPADVKEAVALADSHGWPRSNVWMMPEGTDTARLRKSFAAIAQASIDHRVNICHRLQILAFGNTRGT